MSQVLEENSKRPKNVGRTIRHPFSACFIHYALPIGPLELNGLGKTQDTWKNSKTSAEKRSKTSVDNWDIVPRGPAFGLVHTLYASFFFFVEKSRNLGSCGNLT